MKIQAAHKKSVFFTALAVLLLFAGKRDCLAKTAEREPNNTFAQANVISVGEEYTGRVLDTDSAEDEDHFKIYLTEDNFYKISVYNMADNDDYGSKNMVVSYYKNANDYGDALVYGSDYSNRTCLLKASYTGYHYIKFYNTTDTSYSFKIENYSPKGVKVYDSDNNTYTFLDNNRLEFTQIASKNKKDFYFRSYFSFSTINGMEVIDYGLDEYDLVSIGDYAFKGSAIKSITIEESIIKIGTGAFQNCKKLGSEKYGTGVTIYGKNVVIGKNAFSGCKKLKSIRVSKKASLKSVGKNALKGTAKNIKIEVPKVSKYKKLFKNSGAKKAIFSKVSF